MGSELAWPDGARGDVELELQELFTQRLSHHGTAMLPTGHGRRMKADGLGLRRDKYPAWAGEQEWGSAVSDFFTVTTFSLWHDHP